MSVLALFDKPLKAVSGVSLREADRDLYKRIDRMFQRRNRIAHDGHIFSRDRADEVVQAAASAFRWLRDLSAIVPFGH